MPLNAINYVLTKSVLDRAVGERPTDEQKSEINRAAAISAFVPGTLGLAVPFITRDRIVGEDGGEGEGGEGEGGEEGEGGSVEGKDVAAALASLQKSVEANTRELGTIQADVKGLRRDVDELKAAAKKTGTTSGTT